MTLSRLLFGFLLIATAGFAALATYRVLEAQIEADVYHERLSEISHDLELLRGQFNEVVRKTAITELWVDGDELSVTILSGDGSRKTFLTPFDPRSEIYVDYVVVNGRLWIRRVFDESTAPDRGMLIDPNLADVDWSDENASHGKATYRELHDGRWVVTVTGDGSLGLAPSTGDDPTPLSDPPPLRDYAPVAEHVATALRKLSAKEIALALARRFGAPIGYGDPRE